MAYDAWGARRDLQGDAGVVSAASGYLNGQALIDNKGFTRQEELDQLGLVHLNGRVYDPFTGRFLSGDPHVQDPYHSQSYNRYTYVWNNPTNATDPTGFDEVPNDQKPPEKVEITGRKEPTGLTWGQRFDYIRRAASDAAVGAGRAVARVARPVGNFTARVTVRAAPTIAATSVGSIEVGSNINPGVDVVEVLEWAGWAVFVAATADEITSNSGDSNSSQSSGDSDSNALSGKDTHSATGGPDGDGDDKNTGKSKKQEKIDKILKDKNLPTNGDVKFEPPKNWNPSEPMQKGDQNGFLDRYGREWTKGPSRTEGEHFEWDVQLKDGTHLNVDWSGKITH